VARRKTSVPLTLAVLALVGCACASPGASPTAAHTSARKVPSTAPPSTTSTTLSAVPTTVTVPVTQATGWASMLTTLPPGGGFSSLSCLSDTFCIAAGGGTGGQPTASVTTSGAGVTVSWDGASWSDPSVYYPAPATGPVTVPILPTLTCTLGPTCVIVDGSGHVSTGNGTDWSTPTALRPGVGSTPVPSGGAGTVATASVACPTPTFCAMVDSAGQADTMQGSTWAAVQTLGSPSPPPTGDGRVGISCPTASFCRAVVGTAVVDWNGTSWSVEPVPWTTALAPGASDTAIACPSTTLCAIVSGSLLSYRHGNGPWSPVEPIDPHGGLDAISCPTTSFCMAADAGGSVTTWTGGSWSAPRAVLPEATDYPGIGTSLSCTRGRFCMLMNADGDFSTYAAS